MRLLFQLLILVAQLLCSLVLSICLFFAWAITQAWRPVFSSDCSGSISKETAFADIFVAITCVYLGGRLGFYLAKPSTPLPQNLKRRFGKILLSLLCTWGLAFAGAHLFALTGGLFMNPAFSPIHSWGVALIFIFASAPIFLMLQHWCCSTCTNSSPSSLAY